MLPREVFHKHEPWRRTEGKAIETKLVEESECKRYSTYKKIKGNNKTAISSANREPEMIQ